MTNNNKKLFWLTTMPNPISPAHTHTADCGQVGWRLHLVNTGIDVRDHPFAYALPENEREIDVSPALCGLRAKHGWGLDMFIDAPCKRCKKIADQLNIVIPEI